MILLVLGIGVLCFVIGLCIDDEDIWGLGIFVSCVAMVALFIAGCGLFNRCHVIPKQIAMYEEENAVIEEKISSTVQHYMEYEKGIIYEVADNESPISLVSLYPELSSDKLVAAEIDVYISNNQTIKELKAKEISKSAFKFAIFFGH